jgi:hypothetical protein
MDQPSSDTPSPSQNLGQLSLRLLIKTVIKCALWFGAAWLITALNPGIVWPWYVAWTFVAIGMGFSLLLLALAFLSRYREINQ